jgi:hypothetical protein
MGLMRLLNLAVGVKYAAFNPFNLVFNNIYSTYV